MWQFDLDSSALLVIDMQRDFVEPGRAMEVPMARERLPHMRELIDGARAAKVPVASDDAQRATLAIDTYFGRVLSNEHIMQGFMGTPV